MTPSKETFAAKAHRVWSRCVFWVFATIGLVLLVLEHRAHLLGWWLHALFGLCIVLLSLLIRSEEDSARKSRPR